MPGEFEYWKLADANYPYPFGEIDVVVASEMAALVTCHVKFPAAIPYEKTAAGRSVGITNAWKIAFGLRSEEQAGGKIASRLVCTARHVTWFPDHGETGPGGEQSFDVPEADIGNADGSQVKDIAHGHHFDRVTFSWMPLPTGEVHLTIMALHRTFGKIGEVDTPTVTPSHGEGDHPGEKSPPAPDALEKATPGSTTSPPGGGATPPPDHPEPPAKPTGPT